MPLPLWYFRRLRGEVAVLCRVQLPAGREREAEGGGCSQPDSSLDHRWWREVVRDRERRMIAKTGKGGEKGVRKRRACVGGISSE